MSLNIKYRYCDFINDLYKLKNDHDTLNHLELEPKSVALQINQIGGSEFSGSDFINKIYKLIHKIIKPHMIYKKYKTFVTKAHEIILSNYTDQNNIVIYIKTLYKLMKKYKFINKSTEINKNHTWISGKLAEFLVEQKFNSDIRIVDIGGGDGDVICNIASIMSIPYKNLFCIENKETWIEKYKFENNINYIFWDNQHINVESNSVDVIFIIVMLHHTNDSIMNNIILNAKRLLKPNGIIILKEHDCDGPETKHLINWEHYLYMLLNKINNDHDFNIEEYTNSHVDNYKTIDYFDNLFETNGFVVFKKLNRWFENSNIFDHSNITKLFWAVYKLK
jgi:ubiquinone/menaquinone biosynthesis C-methylase UbiE